MSARQRHRKHANPFSFRDAVAAPDWSAIYDRPAPLALDVGFGAGGFLLELARRHPEWNVLGLEIRPHLVEDAVAAARQEGLRNLHAVLANANMHLQDLVPDGAVSFVAVNFPDPWYKTRHHKRRVVRPEWLEVLTTKLAPGAEVHAMSDYEPIAAEMLQVLEGCAGLVNLAGPGRLASESTTGIMTEREIKHLGRGEPVYRMHFRWEPAPRTR